LRWGPSAPIAAQSPRSSRRAQAKLIEVKGTNKFFSEIQISRYGAGPPIYAADTIRLPNPHQHHQHHNVPDRDDAMQVAVT
jgi:hypothetical protein